MIHEMRCGYGTLRTTAVTIWHQVSHRPAQSSQQLQNETIVIVKSCNILNAPPSPQVLSGRRENALAQSQCTMHRYRGGGEFRIMASGLNDVLLMKLPTTLNFGDAAESENDDLRLCKAILL